MDFNAMPNPYDFANPVTHADMFFGRSAEMSEIRYYLDHAAKAERPINIALLGDRAAGKTSILNMTELEARRREFCAVRIDLDENDAMQLMFFYKMFDGILTTACQCEAFGGLTGTTYQTYLNTTNTYTVPEDKLFSPFLFPIQYALAMKAGNSHAPVSNQQVKHDLSLVSKEIQTPVVVLFDESNVLAGSRVLLEKLRNIFMNIPGYMLVLTGTPDLFPIMDDVFSPIVRQFKKIGVKEFSDKSDTAACVRSPLAKFKIPVEVSDSEVNEIHELSGGKPYEIQLICHLLFRRIQGQRSSRMQLDLGVLDELRRELERSQDISSRPILGAVKSLNTKQLRALGALTACDGHASFDELWNLHYVFEGMGQFSKNQLQTEFEILKERKILFEKDGVVRFGGDYFDRLFTKYFAAEQKIKLDIRSLPFEIELMLGILRFVRPMKDFSVAAGVDSWSAIESLARKLADRSWEEDLFRTSPPFLEELYFEMIQFRKQGAVPALFVSLNFGGAGTAAMVTPQPGTSQDQLDKVKRNLTTVKSRVENLGGALLLERRDIPVASVEELAKKVLRSDNQTLRKAIAKKHGRRLSGAYLAGKAEEADLHASLALRYEPLPEDPGASVNLGYFFHARGENERAENLLQHTVQISGDKPETRALALYDLSILRMQSGGFGQALELLGRCADLLRELPESQRKCGCLEIPHLRDGRLTFSEAHGPDLQKICVETTALIGKLSASGQTGARSDGAS